MAKSVFLCHRNKGTNLVFPAFVFLKNIYICISAGNDDLLSISSKRWITNNKIAAFLKHRLYKKSQSLSVSLFYVRPNISSPRKAKKHPNVPVVEKWYLMIDNCIVLAWRYVFRRKSPLNKNTIFISCWGNGRGGAVVAPVTSTKKKNSPARCLRDKTQDKELSLRTFRSSSLKSVGRQSAKKSCSITKNKATLWLNQTQFEVTNRNVRVSLRFLLFPLWCSASPFHQYWGLMWYTHTH